MIHMNGKFTLRSLFLTAGAFFQLLILFLALICGVPTLVNGAQAQPVITGPGAGLMPLVKKFDSNASLISSFFAYNPRFLGGVHVAGGDVNGDGITDIITGTGPALRSQPLVRIFDGATGKPIFSFMAYAGNFHGGVFVAEIGRASCRERV